MLVTKFDFTNHCMMQFRKRFFDLCLISSNDKFTLKSILKASKIERVGKTKRFIAKNGRLIAHLKPNGNNRFTVVTIVKDFS